MKTKVKSKAKSRSKSSNEPLPFLKTNHSLSSIKHSLKTLKSRHHRKKYWLLVILVVSLVWYLSQSWLVRASFSQYVTYPKVSVLGTNVGNLNVGQLDSKLSQMKSEFDLKKVTLNNDNKQWVFDTNELGVTFDLAATSQSVWNLNNLGFTDKYRLLTGSISPEVVPTISVNNDTCVKALSVIPAVQVAPKDASVYFDQTAKIKPDQPGTKFNATLTCQELPKQLSTNSFVSNVSLDVTAANLTRANLEPKLSQIQSMIGKSVSVKSGSYQQTLTSEQLLVLLDITKKGSDVQVSWSSDRLDELVNNISTQVDTYNSSPALGACQYLSSSGGYWLDKAATKKIFTDLGADSPRSYTLSINYYAPVIGTRTPLARGNSGTIYLTYDDGLTYADRIMNYASCYGIKVTFFELGTRVGTDAVALRRAIAEGHAVQSHGYEHAMYDYGNRSYEWQDNDIKQSINAIMGVTGVRPTYFRPPGGNRSDNTYTAANANGVKLILWGDSSRDSAPSGVNSAGTCANVLAGAYPGATVLMHSTNYSTAEALPCIAEGLAARGYTMEALR